MQKWQELAENMAREEGIFSDRINATQLCSMFDMDQAVVRMKDQKIIGFIGLWDMDGSDWFELGSVWVDPNFRGAGLISQMFEEALTKRRFQRNVACVVNGSKAIIHLLLKNKFKEVRVSQRSVWGVGGSEKNLMKRCLQKKVSPRIFFSYV